MGEESLARRYGFKLGASLVGVPIGLAQQFIVTHALGPAGYGSYTFLTGIFTEVIAFFDSGTSTGFYAKLCSRPEDIGLVAFYWRFASAVGLLLLGGISFLFLVGASGRIWPGETSTAVFLALAWAFAVWILGIAGKIVDAHGCTTAGERMRLVGRSATVFALLVLFALRVLNLMNLFVIQIAGAAFLLLLWQKVLRRSRLSLAPRLALHTGESTRYGCEFWTYSNPLLVYAIASMLAGLLDRWLLQTYAGGVQQGFYGLGYQVSTFCLLFTSAMVPLATREFARAHHSGDQARLRDCFQRNGIRLFWIAAALGVFMATQADRIALILGGSQFAGATMAIALMALYPIHQTYSQLAVSVFYATGQTGLYRNLGLLTIAAGMALSLWILGPTSRGGLALGSIGLAVKMLAAQMVGVNIHLWVICRQLRIPIAPLWLHQLGALVSLGLIAWLGRVATQGLGSIELVKLAAAGALYAMLTLVLVYAAPGIAGFTRSDRMTFLARFCRA